MKKSFSFSFILLSTLFFANLSTAQTASGKIIYSHKSPEEVKTVNGVTFHYATIEARLETDDPNSPFNQATGVCVSRVVPTGEGNSFIHGSCIFADKSGDTFVVNSFDTEQDKIDAIFTKGGTGKFKNLTAQGISTIVGAPDTGKKEDCCMAKWTIDYEM